MKLLSVIPILKGTAPETLSYFGGDDVSVGSLVKVPVRKKLVPALVVSTKDASTSKADIKTASFSLKKIDSVIAEHCFDASLMRAIERTAILHATTIGPALAALIPPAIIDASSTLVSSIRSVGENTEPRSLLTPSILQASFAERIIQYKARIRESFAQQKSIVVVAPTIAEAETLYRELSHGIDTRVVFVHTGLTNKRLVASWKKCLIEEQPVCIIGTHITASIDRADIGTIILEHESSQFYKQQSRPYIDTRVALREIATAREIRLVYGDCFLRIETLAPFVEENTDGLRATFRQDVAKPFELIDMSELPTDEKRSALAPRTLMALVGATKMNERSFVYTLRKGHSSFTVCRDCGTVLLCDRCDAPMVLHLNHPKDSAHLHDYDSAKQEGRSFSCHRCGRRRDTHTVCEDCGSWRLEMYGTGVEKITETLKDVIMDTPIFMLSADSASTPAQIKKIIDAWKESSNGILVGTDMALAHIRGVPLGCGVVASVDTLLALPDIGMQERVFRLLCEMRDISDRLFVQTRNASAPAFEAARLGNGWELYQREIANRKVLNYPPYTKLIKITRSGNKDIVMNDLETVKKLCEPYQTLIYPAFVSKIKNQHIAHALVIVPRESWPDTSLIESLRTLPPQFSVNVAPESVL